MTSSIMTEKSTDMTTRQKYRSLLNTVADAEQAWNSGKSNPERLKNISECMNDTNTLFEGVKDTQVCLMDAKIISQVSSACLHQAQNLSTNMRSFEPEEFAYKVLEHMGGSVSGTQGSDNRTIPLESWTRVGLAAFLDFKVSPFLSFFNGSLPKADVEELASQRRRVNRNRKSVFGTATKTKVLKDTQDSDLHSESATTKRVVETQRQLLNKFKENQKKPLGYFQFVLDPSSFGNSVENIFHVSFLIKEDKAAIELDDNTGLPVIYPIKKSEQVTEERAMTQSMKVQTIVDLQVSDWQALIENLNITEPMISPLLTREEPFQKQRKI